MARIALTMIAKNEEETLQECLESVAGHVDEIVFVDTGSTDKTVEIAKQFTDRVLHFDWTNDFAEARQFALEAVPDDCDWVVWIDADDVIENAAVWREMAENADPAIDGFVFPYDYAQDPQTGTCMTKLWRERLLRNPKAWKWLGLVHEVLVKNDGTHPSYAVSEACWYRHRRPPSKKVPERNLKIIETYLDKCRTSGEAPDPRMLVYHGSELMAQGRHAEAIPAFYEYLKDSTWEEEKYQAFHKLADCYRACKMWDDAIITELKGLQLRDDWADGFFGLADAYYHKGEWDKVVRWTERGMSLGMPNTLLIIHPLDYTYHPRILLSVALFHLGRIEEALQVTKEALEVVPHDPNLQHNKRQFETIIRNKETVDHAMHLASELVLHEEPLKALEILDRLPHTLQHHPQVLEARRRTRYIIPQAWDAEALQQLAEGDETAVEDLASLPRFQALCRDLEELGSGLRILEVGCGAGTHAIELARLGHLVVGFDLNPVAVELAQARAEAAGVADRVSFVAGTLNDVPGYDYDAAFAFGAIDHVPDAENFLEHLDSRVRPHGLVALTARDGSATDRAELEALGLEKTRARLRVLTLARLTTLVDDSGLGVVRTAESKDSVGYVSYRCEQTTLRHIKIWCPFSYEEWGPQTLDGGIGGSEEAVVHLARELRNLGHRVTVYGGTEGAYDGVVYHTYDKFDPYTDNDIVVLWRTPGPVDYRIQANEVYVWMHDIPNPAEFTPERLARIDRVFVLSEWHRQCLPNVPDEKIWITRNGVTALPSPIDARNPYKVVWGSSPDRGLDILLEVWGKVLQEVPQAELHCYYGFDMYDKMKRPPAFKEKVMGYIAEYNRRAEAAGQPPAVHWHGRVGQQELWDAYSTSAIWAYPTYFDEISCITAMRAQITGAWPVVVPRAALDETCMWGTKVPVADIHSDEGKQQFAEALINELKNPVSIEERSRMMVHCRLAYSWETLAMEWSELFERTAVPA